MRKFISYLRVSTQEQGKSGLGIESQRAIIARYVAEEKGVIEEEYVEFASGKNVADREILRTAVKDAISRGCYLAVAKTDRLSRNVNDTIDIWRKLEGNIFICDLPIREGRIEIMHLLWQADMAQRELELIRMRCLNAYEAKRARGIKHNSGHLLNDEHRMKGSKTMQERRKRFYEDNRLVFFVEGLIRDDMTIEDMVLELNHNDFRTITGKPYTEDTAKLLWKKIVRNRLKKDLAKTNTPIPEKIKIPDIYKPQRRGFKGAQTIRVNNV